MSERYFFGLDGGGTQSRLAVCDSTGTILKEVYGGTTNLYTGKSEQVALNLKALFTQVEQYFPFAGGCIGSAGLGREREKVLFRDCSPPCCQQFRYTSAATERFSWSEALQAWRAMR